MLTFGLLCAVFACENQAKKPQRPKLIVTHPVALREQADEKSPELVQLENATELADLNQVSHFLASVYLDGRLFQEPWLRVETKSGQQGWVFAGAVRPAASTAPQHRDWILEKRFQALFGLQLTQRWQAWTARQEVRSDSAFSLVLREGLYLRDTVNQLMATLATRDPGQSAPDLYWLGESAPYFIIQQIADHSTYYLFLDFKVVAEKAAQTSGAQDDQFARVGFLAFPIDSIESPLPAWVFPLSMEESCSNLGAGKHLIVLRAIDQALQTGRFFQPELRALKDWILDDILDKNRTYWQPQEKIVNEMNQIRAAKFTCLNARDRLALEARLAMFEQAEKNNLRLNLRSGE